MGLSHRALKWGVQTLTDGAAVSWDVSDSLAAKVTIAGDRTMAAPTGAGVGQSLVLEVIQDATGGRSISFDSAYVFPNGQPFLAQSPGAKTVYEFFYDGTSFASTQGSYASSYSETLTAAAATYTVTHNLGTSDVDVIVRRLSDNQIIYPDAVVTSSNVVTISFASAQAASANRVTIMGKGAASVSGGGSGSTNLGNVPSPTGILVTSDSGTDTTLPAADGTNAGLMLPSQFTKLSFVSVTQSVDLDAMELQGNNLVTLSGVASNSTNLGTFTGTTISDNQTVKSALQDLETSVETKLSKTLTSAQIFVGNGSNVATGVSLSGDATLANTGALTLASTGVAAGSYTLASVTVDAKGRVTSISNGSAGTGVTNLTATLGATSIIVVSDTGTDATLPAADGTNAGLMVPAQFNKLGFITVTQSVDLDAMETQGNNLVTLSGVATNSTTLGTFTGTTIADNRTVKQALQDLETSVETKLGSTLASGQIFVGNGSNVATGVTASGDATIANTGAITLANTAVAAGSYVFTSLTVDSKGRITSASSGSILPASPVAYSGIRINAGTTGYDVQPKKQTLTDAATVAWDASLGYTAKLTLGGNRTLAAPTNAVDGDTFILVVAQDATGSRTLSYNAAYKWVGGVAPVLSTAANAVDILSFVRMDGFMYGTVGKAFA